MVQFNAAINTGNIIAVANKIEFGRALIATSDPIMRAKGVSTYRRLSATADKLLSTLDSTTHQRLMGAACLEIEYRQHDRKVAHQLKLERIEALRKMQEELTFSG